MSCVESVPNDVQGLCVRSAGRREGWTDFLHGSHACKTQLDRQGGRHHFKVLDCLRVIRVVWIPKDRDPSEPWDRLLEQLQSLSGKVGHHERKASDVPARTRKARDQAGFDWIGDAGHDNGDGGRGVLGCLG
jgi:hypothetical protein